MSREIGNYNWDEGLSSIKNKKAFIKLVLK